MDRPRCRSACSLMRAFVAGTLVGCIWTDTDVGGALFVVPVVNKKVMRSGGL